VQQHIAEGHHEFGGIDGGGQAYGVQGVDGGHSHGRPQNIKLTGRPVDATADTRLPTLSSTKCTAASASFESGP